MGCSSSKVINPSMTSYIPQTNPSTVSIVSSDLLGVRLSYFDQFIQENGGRVKFQNLTTTQVCSQFIAAKCRKTGLSICEQLHNESSSDVGPSTWFISHAWSYLFLDTVEATRLTLERLVGKVAASNTIVWFDLFSWKQAGTRKDIAYESLSTTFLKNVRAMGNVLMVMLLWDNPTTLTRAWCVFEAYACLHTGSRFEVAMTRTENDRFLMAIRRDYKTFYKMLTQINSSKSKAVKPSDQQLIHRVIRDKIDGGFTGLDRSIFSELEKWMIHLLRGQIDGVQEDAERAVWQRALGGILDRANKNDQAEPLFKSNLEIYRRLYGDEHGDTTLEMTLLGRCYAALGRYDEAEPLYRDCLASQRRVLGDEHPSTLTSIGNLAELIRSQGRYDEAESLYREELAGRRHVLGDEHSSTLTSINNLAELMRSQGRYDEAEPLYRDCLASQRRVLGDEHSSTLTSINNLAGLLKSQGRFNEAERLYRDCLATKRRVLGNEHPSTLTTIWNMAAMYANQKKYAEAEASYIECLAGFRRVLGESHPHTKQCSQMYQQVLNEIEK